MAGLESTPVVKGPAAMHLAKTLLVGLIAAGLLGCDGHSSPAPASGAPSPLVTKTTAVTAPPSPVSQKVKTDARTIAERFYGLYLGGQFASSWELLAPAAKRQISKRTWVKVHEECLSATARSSGKFKSLTIFGNAAIATESVVGTSETSTLRAVFNYAGGRWGYSPGDLGIYHHGSISADIKAARAAGFCASRNRSIL
jgi:hypothetical protein